MEINLSSWATSRSYFLIEIRPGVGGWACGGERASLVESVGSDEESHQDGRRDPSKAVLVGVGVVVGVVAVTLY